MITPLDPGRYRRAACAAMTLVLLGIMSAIPLGTAAQSSGTPPTVGNITVDNYDCLSGVLDFHVAVTDLPHLDAFDGVASLIFEYNAHYQQGTAFSIPVEGFNPPAEIAPYTGNVYLDTTVPSTYPGEPSNSPVTSIDLRVSVGNGDAGDTSTTTYIPDCGDANGDLAQQLIAVLVQILEDILNG